MLMKARLRKDIFETIFCEDITYLNNRVYELNTKEECWAYIPCVRFYKGHPHF